MAKNIVLLSDGTGQGASMPKAERTNVWKLWDATKKADPANQVTFYDEGLGAEHKRECETSGCREAAHPGKNLANFLIRDLTEV